MTTKCGYSIINDIDFLIKHIPRIFEINDTSGKDRDSHQERPKSGQIDYHYFNDHILRAAVSRVIGLVKVLELENKRNDKNELFDRLLKSCDELQSVMQQASNILITDIPEDKDRLNLNN